MNLTLTGIPLIDCKICHKSFRSISHTHLFFKHSLTQAEYIKDFKIRTIISPETKQILSKVHMGNLNLYAATGSASGGSLPGGWVNTLSTTWSQCGITISSAATGVTEIGMQLLYGGGASNYAHVGPVTVNIASVSITDGPSVLPTATYTPTMIPNYSPAHGPRKKDGVQLKLYGTWKRERITTF